MSTRPPTIVPVDQLQPPSQTAWGCLEIVDPPELNTPPGEPLTDELLTMHLEFCESITVSSSDPYGKTIFSCDPLTYIGSSNWYNVANEPQPQYLLSTRTCLFSNVTPCLVFQPVKPVGVPCRLIFRHTPRVKIYNKSHDSAYGTPLLKNQTPLDDANHEEDKFYRGIKIEWDLSNPISLNFPAWNTAINRLMRIPLGGGLSTTTPPVETFSGGELRLEVAQRPMPGSIYPEKFQINVFKCLSKFKPEVLTSYSYDYMIATDAERFVV